MQPCGGRARAPTRAPRAGARYSATLLVATPIDSREFFDQRAVRLLDADAVTGRPGIAARAAVDVGDDRVRCDGIRADGRRQVRWRSTVRVARRTQCVAFGWARRDVIEDALAAVALDDLVVAQDVVEDLRPEADVADRADAVAGFGDRDAVAAPRDELEDREHLLVERGDDRRALAGDALERAPSARRAPPPSPCGRRRRPSARAASSASARLTRRGQLVGLDHPLEDLLFERLDLALRERDLLLDGVVFLVGLHRHRLFAELRQAALVDGDVLLDRAARVLVVGQRAASRSPGARARLRGARRTPSRAPARRPAGVSASCAAESSRCSAMTRSRSAFIRETKKPRRSSHRGFQARMRDGALARWSVMLSVCIARTSFDPRCAPSFALTCIWRTPSHVLAQSVAHAHLRDGAKVGPPGFEPGTGRL